MARACREHGITLTGGETAQLPDVYAGGHYDVAGTILGIVDEHDVLHGDRVRPGDAIIGYEATGLHTNGYSLARRVVFDTLGLACGDQFPDHEATVADVLLAVHRSYDRAVRPALPHVHALAHVTGGGLPGNLIRVLPEGCRAVLQPDAWPEPRLFEVLRRVGKIDEAEMRRVFNLGLGFLAVVPTRSAEAVCRAARAAGTATWIVGAVEAGPREVAFA
jgi:phosphoribosylformylglycinamidine cyclo-ligase